MWSLDRDGLLIEVVAQADIYIYIYIYIYI